MPDKKINNNGLNINSLNINEKMKPAIDEIKAWYNMERMDEYALLLYIFCIKLPAKENNRQANSRKQFSITVITTTLQLPRFFYLFSFK